MPCSGLAQLRQLRLQGRASSAKGKFVKGHCRLLPHTPSSCQALSFAFDFYLLMHQLSTIAPEQMHVPHGLARVHRCSGATFLCDEEEFYKAQLASVEIYRNDKLEKVSLPLTVVLRI